MGQCVVGSDVHNTRSTTRSVAACACECECTRACCCVWRGCRQCRRCRLNPNTVGVCCPQAFSTTDERELEMRKRVHCSSGRQTVRV